jgi:integrase
MASRRGAGEGGLAKNASTGLWEVRIELPPDSLTGARRRKVVRRKAKGEAIAEMRRLKSELQARGDLPTGIPTIAQWADFWQKNIDITRSKARTRAGRRSHLTQYILPAVGGVKLDRLDDRDLQHFVERMVIAKGLSTTTARAAWVTLEAVVDAAVRRRILGSNLMKTSDFKPRRAVPNISVLKSDEAITVIRTSINDRLAARWALALLTGMRQGEVLGIELDQVDLEANKITIAWQLQTLTYSHGCKKLDAGWECGWTLGHKCPTRFLDANPNDEMRQLSGVQYLVRPKTMSSHREVPLVGALRDVVANRVEAAKYEPNPYNLLFTGDPKKRWYPGRRAVEILPLDGKPVDASTDSKARHALLKRSGVPDVRLHDARRTTISLLYTLDIPETVIEDIAGHSSPEISRHYRDVDLKPAEQALKKLDELLRI